MKKFKSLLLPIILSLMITGCSTPISSNSDKISENTTETTTTTDTNISSTISLDSIPQYSGTPYIEINGNIPQFTEEEKQNTTSFEQYSELDSLGRCGVAFANVGQDLMPTEKRGPIGMIKPSGWHTVKYDCVDGKFCYNRCHILGYQLSGENANEKNLITGTRYLNVEGMLPFENQVADYVKETNHHVLYRVTPIFKDDELVASGVQIEAYSVEDNGQGICFNVYVYNVQPGITIDYKTGESKLENTTDKNSEENSENISEGNSETVNHTYILNKNTKKFHKEDCSSVKQMSEKNKEKWNGNREELLNQGYEPCENCKP